MNIFIDIFVFIEFTSSGSVGWCYAEAEGGVGNTKNN